MNPMNRMISIGAMALVALAGAPMAPAAGLRIKTQELPPFPFELIQQGVREGTVSIAFSVDAAGKVEDCLAVAYTHVEFAEAAVRAIRRWTFEPGRVQGQAIATATQVTVNFEVQGTTVISLNPAEATASWTRSLDIAHDAYYPRTVAELDRIPGRLVAPAPAYPRALADRGKTGEVRVKFYIDETGAVRLPAVDEGNDGDLAALAIQALNQWKFEPPICKGRVVLMKAAQVFRFHPPASATTRSGAGD
jgi:periplasmic protein TonB